MRAVNACDDDSCIVVRKLFSISLYGQQQEEFNSLLVFNVQPWPHAKCVSDSIHLWAVMFKIRGTPGWASRALMHMAAPCSSG
jgi:hypothetical protein